MKYVFYDAESIDKEHKCSFTFGYLVTDENFNILVPKEDIVFALEAIQAPVSLFEPAARPLVGAVFLSTL